MAAGNSLNLDDVVSASNMGRKAVSEMLVICKVIIQTSFGDIITDRKDLELLTFEYD